LAQKFWALTHNSWDLYLGVSVSREIDGTIRHGTTNNVASFHNSLSTDLMVEPPAKIQEDQARLPNIGLGRDKR
jgi:hypothetical protein